MGADGGPIFIVGAMGSGTTLLRLMLDSHPHIAIPHETGFMRAYKAHRFAPFKHSGRNWTRRLGWEPEEFRELMRGFYDQLFMRYAEQHGKRRWGEKTPLHTWHVDDILKLFPDARVVAMVRHPLGSAASNISRFGTPVRKARSHWARYNREIARQAERHADRMVVLRYEDLLLRPEATARELLEWLGEPWSEAVLEHHRVQAERGGKVRVEGRTKADEAIDAARLDKWTRTLAPTTRDYLAPRMQRLGRFWGYSVDDPAVLEPIGAPDRILIDGEQIARRIDETPELDLRRVPELSPYEQLYDPKKVMMMEREAFNELLAPKGLRRVVVAVVRRLPGSPRRGAIAAARRVRRVLRLGPRRRPVRTYDSR